MLQGCQSKSKDLTITERTCPECGAIVELFSVDSEVACDNCGFVVYNDTLNCVQWCKHARECVGEAVYENMMKIVARRKEQQQKELEEKKKEREKQAQ